MQISVSKSVKTTPPISITCPANATDWSRATRLVKLYIASLRLDLSFQNIDTELKNLSVEYGPPSGCFFIASIDGREIGCIGLRKYEDGVCEMKRLYTLPETRGNGVGKMLIERIIEEARKLNYKKILLDTLPTMSTAQSIYKSFGFTEIPPYRFNPVQGTTYLQLLL